MSSGNRATSKGGKVKSEKSQKSEKSENKGKGGDKQQNRDSNSKNEDPSIKDKVKQLIEMSQRSEEEVCLALHECDYDMNQATNMLFEEMTTGEWETRVKKKKNRQASASKQDKADENAPVEEWNDALPPLSNAAGGDKDKPRGGSRGGRQNNRGWRGRERERQENDRNAEDRPRGDRDRRGRPGGGPRGGGSGRGGRGGGRTGGRYLPRGNRNNNAYKPIDTWDSSNTWDNNTVAVTNHVEDNWDDFPGTDEWSTEEYQGSLADTKVFTPSIPSSAMDPVIEQSNAMSALQDPTFVADQLVQHTPQRPSQSPVPPMMGSLTAAQTQYFSQLQQNNDSLAKSYQTQPYQSQTYEKPTTNQYATNTSPQYNSASTNAYGSSVSSQSYGTGTQQYGTQTNSSQYGTQTNSSQYGTQTNSSQYGTQTNSSQYGTDNTYQSNVYVAGQETASTQQPTRTKPQRARVPPPSKIPASAVEMPGDLNSSIGYLDVQFGAMDLIDANSSFDGGIETKYGTTTQSTNSIEAASVVTPSGGSLDLSSSSVNQNSSLDAYSPKTNTQNSISSALSQSLSNSDSIPQTTDHLTNTYSSAPRTTTQGSTPASSSVTAAGLDLGGSKQPPDTHSYSQSSTYSSYQPKTNTYNSSTYSGTTSTVSSYVTNQANSYANSQTGSYNAASGNTYPSTYSSNSSYQSSTNSTAYPSISQANSYSSNTPSYPQNTSQSVYGASTGLNNSSSYGNTTTNQYNSYSSTNKISKDSSVYENSSSTSSSSQTTSTSSVTTTTPLSLSQSGVTTSKTSTALVKNSNSIVSNMPPNVTPVMSMPYIGQVPYFQQPIYSFEDMQMLQQRLPHMLPGDVDLVPSNVTNLCIYPTQTTTPYYDMSYQTPTTMPAVRDAAALGNVGYSLSDGRFARTDNNASPVPTTLSQQTSTLTQGHQGQPILTGTAPPPYFYATAFNTIAPNYQFGMYTQLPATNAHGSSNSTQYPKPATYSNYGNYDTLGQSQDYTKAGYVSNTQGQKGSAANASSTGSTATDLSAMYGKSHTALGKVNSYEKQGFHSGTPPPFTGGIHGSQNAGLAPGGTGYAPPVYIPTLPPHQQHLMQQPLHQDSGTTAGQRSQATNQAKTGPKQPYQTSYWNQP
uniref:Protein lingerer isoform X2 n=1 Tax=Diabrotica virgifera virgifera TaxID=50390 RepID=A0A6P7FAI0_DIAVI